MTNQQTYQRDGQTFLSKEAFRYLFNNELLVDATAGGLVLAPSEEDGIMVVQMTNQGESLLLPPVEDWCYLINAFAYAHYYDELNALIKPAPPIPFTPIPVPPGILTVEIKPKLVDGRPITPVLYLGSSETIMLVPHQAKAHLFDLDRINREAWQKYYVDQQPANTLNNVAMMARNNSMSDN